MDFDILSKEYVLHNGINYDNLWGEYCSDRILDKPENRGGKPFSGLVYELHNNGNVNCYCFYKDGFEHGDYIEFYDSGKIKSIQHMEYGRIRGKEKVWYENGNLKLIAEYEFGICLNLKEWDCNGSIIKEKLGPTETDLAIINQEREMNKRLGRG